SSRPFAMWEPSSPPACSGWPSAGRSAVTASTSSPPSLPVSVVCSSWPVSRHASGDASEARERSLVAPPDGEGGGPLQRGGDRHPKILVWFVPCPLAARPAAVLIWFAWSRKVPHCVGAGAA